MRKVLTLAIVIHDGRVLLGKKLTKLGAGYWNGFGGKVEEGELIHEAAKRECLEEVGIIVQAIERKGVLLFTAPEKRLGADELEVHIFAITKFSGVPSATREMDTPTWFAFSDIPYDEMWPDDRFWLPLLLAGKSFEGTFAFNAQGEIASQKLVEIKSIANTSIPRTIS